MFNLKQKPIEIAEAIGKTKTKMSRPSPNHSVEDEQLVGRKRQRVENTKQPLTNSVKLINSHNTSREMLRAELESNKYFSLVLVDVKNNMKTSVRIHTNYIHI